MLVLCNNGCEFSGCLPLPTICLWSMVPCPPQATYQRLPGEHFQVLRASHQYLWGQRICALHSTLSWPRPQTLWSAYPVQKWMLEPYVQESQPGVSLNIMYLLLIYHFMFYLILLLSFVCIYILINLHGYQYKASICAYLLVHLAAPCFHVETTWFASLMTGQTCGTSPPTWCRWHLTTFSGTRATSMLQWVCRRKRETTGMALTLKTSRRELSDLLVSGLLFLRCDKCFRLHIRLG